MTTKNSKKPSCSAKATQEIKGSVGPESTPHNWHLDHEGVEVAKGQGEGKPESTQTIPLPQRLKDRQPFVFRDKPESPQPKGRDEPDYIAPYWKQLAKKAEKAMRPIVPESPQQLKLQVDECPDANGFTTIRRYDGTSSGDTEAQPIATVYNSKDAQLIVRACNAYPHAERLAEALGNVRMALTLSYNGKKKALCEQYPELEKYRLIATEALADWKEAQK
jgi:hypothetical protein